MNLVLRSLIVIAVGVILAFLLIAFTAPLDTEHNHAGQRVTGPIKSFVVDETHGSPAYQGNDVGYMNSYSLRACDREVDGSYVTEVAINRYGNVVRSVSDRNGAFNGCASILIPNEYRAHQTIEFYSGGGGQGGPVSYH
jgi:hypothetical protein